MEKKTLAQLENEEIKAALLFKLYSDAGMIPAENKPEKPESKPENKPDMKTLVSTFWNDPDDVENVYALASAISHSVLKRVLNPTAIQDAAAGRTADNGNNGLVRRIKSGISHDVKVLFAARDIVNSSHIRYTKSGDAVRVYEPGDAGRLADVLGDTVGDGADIVHECIVSLLEQRADAIARGALSMESPYTARRLSSRVYIKRADSAAVKDVETRPIIEVFRAARRYIASTRAEKIDTGMYVYVPYTVTDGDGNIYDSAYFRAGKCADIGGYVTDYNGKNTVYTADTLTVEKIADKVVALSLTARQATILKLRFKGYGYKAIATYLDATPDAVKSQVKEIRRKALRAGLDPAKMPAEKSNDAPRRSCWFRIDGDGKTGYKVTYLSTPPAPADTPAEKPAPAENAPRCRWIYKPDTATVKPAEKPAPVGYMPTFCIDMDAEKVVTPDTPRATIGR